MKKQQLVDEVEKLYQRAGFIKDREGIIRGINDDLNENETILSLGYHSYPEYDNEEIPKNICKDILEIHAEKIWFEKDYYQTAMKNLLVKKDNEKTMQDLEYELTLYNPDSRVDVGVQIEKVLNKYINGRKQRARDVKIFDEKIPDEIYYKAYHQIRHHFAMNECMTLENVVNLLEDEYIVIHCGRNLSLNGVELFPKEWIEQFPPKIRHARVKSLKTFENGVRINIEC